MIHKKKMICNQNYVLHILFLCIKFCNYAVLNKKWRFLIKNVTYSVLKTGKTGSKHRIRASKILNHLQIKLDELVWT
ncbi:hypothetical protein HMPREF2738_01157 [Clostridiales bacterium KLE1615]|nr:hypothetical protein HMPREF2738_01157 [Clostridiales bacterium KLE1615]